MPGPVGKHPSVRNRRNNPKAGFTSLPGGGRTGESPDWPLLPDTMMTAQRELATDKVASLQLEIEGAEDGRTKGRLRRQLATAEQTAAVLSLQLEQQGDLEREMWAMLWSTPQAKLWEASDSFARMLAQFVRWSVKGEQGDLDAAKEARIRGKDFGLTPSALMSLKAEIERAEEAEDKGERRRQSRPPKPAKGEPEDDPRGVFLVS